ncbi:MAG: imidazole glycerol phosphate synthase subunit HisH [Planctomycetota bacterium]|jgi:glutamine amidotransferase|nr:imidazole glycerol phosphate synthase subunit HisH [Deltaproteobacteria bacterium]MDP6540597.1 imidazole glycerol phosphate synthase subunit HisH [Planctomycetota bacterium]
MAQTSPKVAVVDYGAGNLRSVAKALERSGLRAEVAGDAAGMAAADAVVLPGVGAFADAMQSLQAKGLDDAVRRGIESGRPYLGLCLGLQLLFDASEEHGENAGFGLLPGRVQRFPERAADESALRVPHIGWNEVCFEGSHPMLEGLPERDVYYFVHSFHPVPADPAQRVGATEYGGRTFCSAAASGSAFAVQFHPEKSQSSGRRLLDAFARWIDAC